MTTHPVRKLILILSIFLSVVLHSQTTAYAQLIAVSGSHGELANQLTAALEWQRENLETRFRIRLAELDNACELSPAQEKQLKIAIKGTVTTCMNNANKQIVEAASDLGLSFDPEKPDEWEADGDAVSAFLDPQFYFGEEDHKFWNSTLEKTLTVEQTERWQAWIAHRNDIQKKLAISRFLIAVDQQLRLTDAQREALEKIIGEQYGDQFLRNLDKRPQGTIDFSKNTSVDKQDNKYQMVVDLLTEDQLQIWSTVFIPVLRSLR